MKNENDNLMMNSTMKDSGYIGIGDKKSNRKSFFTITLPQLVEKIQNKIFDEITDDSRRFTRRRSKNYNTIQHK